MRILVHTISYRPELTGVAKYTAELCEWIAAQGHEVRVVAPPPYYPQWRVQRPYSQWRYAGDTLSGVRVRRCPIWLPTHPRGIGRVMYELSFALASLPVMLREALHRPDLVLVVEPSFLNAPVAWLAARLAGAVAWLHIQDFEIDLAFDLGQLRAGRRAVDAVESWILGRFDAVSSITRRMLSKARAKGVAEQRLYLLPNWVDVTATRPLPHKSPMRTELGIPENCFVALFAGSLCAKQGAETIIDAAQILAADTTLLFVVCGEGVTAQSLRAHAKGLGNVRFLPLQPPDRLNDLLNLADVHLLPQRPSAAGSVMPSKLIGMLASGRPVIAACTSGTEIAELATDCGVIIEPGDPDALAAAVRNLASDPSKCRELGEQARQRALDLFQHHAILADFERELYRRVPCVAGRPPSRSPSPTRATGLRG
jgi:putative colanic acid biosynthesis glycosyltransferase WcaI